MFLRGKMIKYIICEEKKRNKKLLLLSKTIAYIKKGIIKAPRPLLQTHL